MLQLENFVFALNSTLPVFLTILLGFFLRKVSIVNDAFNKVANDYVFKCALPLSLFRSVATMDFYKDFDPMFCLFCFLGTTVMFLGVWGLSYLFVKDKGQIGAFAQASARSSAAVLGIAFATAIYGDTGMVPMMIMAAVPFFNLYSVCILSLSPQVDEDGKLIPGSGGTGAIRKAAVNVAKNPLIISILIAIPFALLRIQLPAFLDSAVKSVGGTATPISLVVLGASFSGGAALTRWKGAVCSSLIKLFVLPAIFLPIAAAMGFRETAMVAILIMVGSPTTVSCYVMAKSMHGDGVLTSNAVMLSTLLSSVSITFWLFVLRSFGLI